MAMFRVSKCGMNPYLFRRLPLLQSLKWPVLGGKVRGQVIGEPQGPGVSTGPVMEAKDPRVLLG